MKISDWISLGSAIISIASLILALVVHAKTKNRTNYELKRDTILSLLIYLNNLNSVPAIDDCLCITIEKPKTGVKSLEVNLRKCFSKDIVNQYDKIITLIKKLDEINYSISRLIESICDFDPLEYEKLKENLIVYYSNLENIEESFKRELFEKFSIGVPLDMYGRTSYNFYELLCESEKITRIISKEILTFEHEAYNDIKSID